MHLEWKERKLEELTTMAEGCFEVLYETPKTYERQHGLLAIKDKLAWGTSKDGFDESSGALSIKAPQKKYKDAQEQAAKKDERPKDWFKTIEKCQGVNGTPFA